MAQLLEAAASVLAEVGYEAATMTEIAERANASIGALYQYFPNKEAIVHALREQFVNELEVRWVPLIAQAKKLSTKDLVDQIIDVFVDYIERRPAYIPLLNAPGYKRDPAVRNRLREHLAAMFREKQPTMTPQVALRVANVSVQVLKGMNALRADAKGTAKQEIVSEFRLVLFAYLNSRLKSG